MTCLEAIATHGDRFELDSTPNLRNSLLWILRVVASSGELQNVSDEPARMVHHGHDTASWVAST